MERKNKSNGKVLFKKVKGGSLYFEKKRIKPGQTFEAFPQDIPEAFKDQLVELEDKSVEKPVKTEVEKESPGYQLKHRGAGWWDVVDKFGKQINDDALRKTDAEEFLSGLEA